MSISGATCLVGTLYLFYLMLRIVRVVVNFLKATFLGGTLDFKSFGEWAVVTGCTDGIGKEYAKQLASKGLNIVLMSRSLEKLNAVASEIENEYKVKTKIIQIDFSGGYEIYNNIPEKLEGLEIGVLVNNVGCSVQYPEYFCEIPLESVYVGAGFQKDLQETTTWKLINVNTLAMTMMSRLIMPAMADRRKGVVINVSSASGDSHSFTPLLSEYGATKSYMDKLSANLQVEYADKGIIIQSVKPLFVATNMTGIKKASLFYPSPDDYVRAVFKKVGTSDECFGYWPHELQALIKSLLPSWAVKRSVYGFMKSIRARALRKKAKSS